MDWIDDLQKRDANSKKKNKQYKQKNKEKREYRIK